MSEGAHATWMCGETSRGGFFLLDGNEDRDILDANTGRKTRLENIRLQAGPLMQLADVAEQSVSKMLPRAGGAISTHTSIPHRCHALIGVLAAVVSTKVPEGHRKTQDIEHPSGVVASAATVRTTRALFDGVLFG